MRSVFLLLGLGATCEGFRATVRPRARPALRLRAEEGDVTTVKQNTNRDLKFDVRTGRFFESDIAEECRDEFCLVDETTGDPIPLTVEEKERIFLDTLQSYYYSAGEEGGAKRLGDDEFDVLKSDLAWEGSNVATLNRKETLFMNAMAAYLKGKPIISDSEFDELKASLKEEGSIIAVQTEPQCYLDTGVCKVTWLADEYKNIVLYIPAFFITTFLWLGASWQLLPPIRYINPILDLALGLPFALWATKKITGLLWQNPLIAKGPCPNCNAENTIYFGDILGVDGFDQTAELKCKNCKEELRVLRSTLRVSTLPKPAAGTVGSGAKGKAATA